MLTRIDTGMATPPRKGIHGRLYILEHMEARGFSDAKLAGVLGVERQTVYRWRTAQRSLTPEKLARMAHAMDMEPDDFYYHPSEPNAAPLIRGEPIDFQKEVIAQIEFMKSRRAGGQ